MEALCSVLSRSSQKQTLPAAGRFRNLMRKIDHPFLEETSTLAELKRLGHFSLQMLCHSDTAKRLNILNVPDPLQTENLQRLALTLGQIEQMLGAKLKINSGFRCPALNEAVGGVPNSQHVEGLAADFVCPHVGSPYDIAEKIIQSGIEFDQLILEFGRWIHISINSVNSNMRNEVLTLCADGRGCREGLHRSHG